MTVVKKIIVVFDANYICYSSEEVAVTVCMKDCYKYYILLPILVRIVAFTTEIVLPAVILAVYTIIVTNTKYFFSV